MVRRHGSSRFLSGLWLLACGEPGTLGSVDPPLVLASAAPGSDSFGQPEPLEGAAGGAGQVLERPEPPSLIGTPVGLGGAGPIDDGQALPDAPSPPAPALPPDEPPTDAGAPSPDSGGAGDAAVRTPDSTPSKEPAEDAGPPADAAIAPLDAGGLPADFTLAILGSSTAAGDGASSPASAWAAQIENTLNARLEGELLLYNFASGGFISSDLLPGSGHPGSIDAALAIEPDLILVALAGSNDVSAGTTDAELTSRLGQLRDSAFAAGSPVFFFSTAPKSLSVPERERLASWAVSLGQSFASCPIPADGAAYAPCFIDVFTPLADASLGLAAAYDSGDGIHINDAGHAVIYDRVRRIVEPFVCSRARCR